MAYYVRPSFYMAVLYFALHGMCAGLLFSYVVKQKIGEAEGRILIMIPASALKEIEVTNDGLF